MIDVVNYRSLPKKIKVNLSRKEIILFFVIGDLEPQELNRQVLLVLLKKVLLLLVVIMFLREKKHKAGSMGNFQTNSLKIRRIEKQ